MQTRENALHHWLTLHVNNEPFTLMPLAGDASFRRYFRLKGVASSRIVMDAPPEKESVAAFINVGNTLTKLNVRIPTIYAYDLSKGFVLLEDLGDQLFLHNLNHINAESLYLTAIDVLQKFPSFTPDLMAIPDFDENHMYAELNLLRTWFLEKYLNLSLSIAEINMLEALYERLILSIMQQPRVFIHRDYHSRNLMILNEADNIEIAVIDFQDAMYGPYTYDLVSLLKDCYIKWPEEKVLQWLQYFQQTSGIGSHLSLTQVIANFDWCGLQRHLKVLGIFARLYLRDNKAAYLDNLPLTMNYVLECINKYSDLQDFACFMQQRVYPTFLTKRALCTQP